uniref:Uncharacterized protein n=1 Tax=Zosterops lateralis melanops TaxID=1220523 RepID=A0A8D2PAX1_ZOSLA
SQASVGSLGGCQAGPLPPGTALRGLGRADGLEVNLLVEGTPTQAQVEALAVPVLHGVDHLLGHAHGEGEVPAHLPHHDGGADVLGLDLDVLPRHLLRDLEAVGPVLVPSVLRAVHEGGGELIHLRLVHFLVHTLLEALEDDGELWGRKGGMHCLASRALELLL